MTNSTRSWVVRLLGEAVAIFAGVVVALAADDWRETQGARQEAHESLQLVVVDLRADSTQFAGFQRTLERHAAAAAWLIEGWDRQDHSADSVAAAFTEFITGGLLNFNRSAFEGLRDTNRLRLIKNEEVRFGITRYYQRTQVTLSDYWDLALEGVFKTNEAAAPYFRQPVGVQSGNLWPASSDGLSLRRSWGEVRADADLASLVYAHGYLVGFLATYLGEVQEEIGTLITQVTEHD